MKSMKHLSRTAEAKRAGGKIEQAAALCCRIGDGGELEILLISSRDTGRWVLPKGYVERDETSCTAALREAREEAGIVGKVRRKALGTYSYIKDAARRLDVAVHVLKVERETEDYRERLQRRKAWVMPAEAATMVSEPELKALFGTLVAKVVLNSQDKAVLKKIRAPASRIPLPGDTIGLAV